MLRSNYLSRRTLISKGVFAFLMISFLIIGSTYAQTETCRTVVEGTFEHHNYPFASASNHSYSQQIYTAEEISAEDFISGDVIKAIVFNYFAETPTKRPIKIFLGNTTLNKLENGWIPSLDLSEVYSSNCHEFSKGDDNWSKIILDNEFTYTGGNIVLAVLMNIEDTEDQTNCFTEKNTNKRFYIDKSKQRISMFVRKGSNLVINLDPETGLPKSGNEVLTSTTTDIRNNIRFCKIGDLYPKVSGIKSNNTTDTELSLHWTPGSNETSWIVEYGEKGFILGNGTQQEVNNPNFVITNLVQASEYDIYIKSKYPNQNQSSWAGPKTLITACGVINSSNHIEDFTKDNTSLNCWTIIDVENNGTTGSSPSGKWRFNQNSAQYRYINKKANDWLISPQINVTENMFVSFDYRSHSTYDYEKFSVWVIKESPANYETNSSVILETQNINNRTYLKTSPLSLEDFVGENVFIGIKCESDASKNILHIDNFRVYNPSSENKIKKFSLPTQTGEANIQSDQHNINIEVSFSTQSNYLSPTIEISEYASISPESGTPQDFTNPVEYTVTAENGNPQIWTVNLTNASNASTENDITEFNFHYQVGSSSIINEDGSITAFLDWEMPLKYISPTIKVSDFATITPESGLVRDFSDPQKYYVTAENGSIKEWTVTIKNAPPPDGASCEKPLLIDLSALGNIYSLTDETTAGFGNEYSNTSLEGYDNGFDKIYKLSVNEKSVYSINLTTTERTVAIALFNGCPSENIIIDKDTAANGIYELNLNDIVLENNKEYFLMVDKKYNPDKIDKYNLTFTKNLSSPCISPSSLEISDILQTSCKISWNQAFMEQKWELKYGLPNFNPDSEGTLITEIMENSYNLTDLVLDSEYSLYIRSKCSDSEIAQWVGPFNFKTLASCPIPTNIMVNAITTNSALISWSGHTANNWDFEYKLETEDNFSIEQVSTNSIQLSNLSNASTYSFRIKSKCSNNQESFYTNEIIFTTNCENVSELPYFENFETHENSENPFPSCWRRSTSLTVETEIFPKIVAGINGMSLKCLKFASPSTIPTIASTQIFDSPIENLVVEFKLRKNSMSSGKMIIGVMTDPNDPNSFIDVLTINPNNDPVIVEDKLDFADYPEISGNNKAIAFKHISNSQTAYYYLDYVRVRAKSQQNDIISFTTNGLISEGIINNIDNSISGTISHNSSPSEQITMITISEHAKISPESGIPQDFTNPVVYTVTAEDGTPKFWTVTLNQGTIASSENKILSFTFPNQEGTSEIEDDEHTVTAKVNWLSGLTNISPVIEISPFASISPTSETSLNFSETVEYTITAQNGDTQIWKVNISIADPPAGTNCQNPVIVDLSQHPNDYTIYNETTKDFENTYSGTQLGDYDNGQDKIYKIKVEENSLYKFSLISNINNIGMGIFNGCPSSNNLIKSSTNQNAGEQSISNVLLQPNQEYFLMVDKRSTPSFIELYNLSFSKYLDPECTSPNNLVVSNILQTSAEFNWTQALSEEAWELKWGNLGFNPTASGNTIPVNTNPSHTVNNLASNSKYHFYIRSKCSDENFGQWIGPISVETLANCPVPTELEIISTTDNSVSITWNAQTAENWIIEYKLASEEDSDYQSLEANSNTATIDGLSNSQNYIIRIKAVCGAGQESEYSQEIDFYTSCESVSSFPYFENFDNNSPSLICWQIIDNNNENNNGLFSTGKWKFSNNQASYFSDGTNNADDWLVSPKMNITDNLYLSFDYKTGGNNYTEKFSIWAIRGDSQTDLSQATQILETQSVNNPYLLRTSLISLNDFTNEEVYIAIKCESQANMLTFTIDNFRIAKLSNENEIISFTVAGQIGETNYNLEDNTIDITVPSSTNLSALTPSITISEFASINPPSQTPQDFTVEVEYTVTAEDSSIKHWKVNISKEEIFSSPEKKILSFSFDNQIGSSIFGDKTVTATASSNAILTNITPNIQVSPFASISPASGIPKDFTNPVEYTVTAQDLSTETWTVTITKENIIEPEIEQHKIISSAGENGTIFPNGEQLVTHGESITFNISPETGYSIDKLIIDDSEENISLVSNNTYTFSEVNGNHSIFVSFKLNDISNHQIIASVNGNNGTITPQGSISVSPGASKKFNFEANPGFKIDILLVDLVDKTTEIVDNSYTFTNVNEDHTIEVKYKAIDSNYFTIKPSVVGNHGTITPSNDISVYAGQDQAFEINPEPGYKIHELLIDGENMINLLVDNKYTFLNVQSNHTIVVKFIEIPANSLKVKASVFGGNGKITPISEYVSYGDNIEFTITPNQGYEIEKLIDNSTNKTGEVNSNNKYFLNNIIQNHNIVVKFKLANKISDLKNNDVSIYPNPVNDILNVKFYAIIDYFEIISSEGKLIHKQSVNNNSFQFDTNILSEGNYIIKLYHDKQTYTKQFSVNR